MKYLPLQKKKTRNKVYKINNNSYGNYPNVLTLHFNIKKKNKTDKKGSLLNLQQYNLLLVFCASLTGNLMSKLKQTFIYHLA